MAFSCKTLEPCQMDLQVVASWTCVETCVGGPNRHTSYLSSIRRSLKKDFKATGLVPHGQNATITQTYPVFHWLIGYYNNEYTSINLNWLGLDKQTVKICVDFRARHCKATQVHARPGQTESQVHPSFQLASTCKSVWLEGLGNFSCNQEKSTKKLIKLIGNYLSCQHWCYDICNIIIHTHFYLLTLPTGGKMMFTKWHSQIAKRGTKCYNMKETYIQNI